MHIFVTNDDGVAAPGIRTLARALSALAKITVIAPAEGVSSCSSALSLRKPMKLKKRQNYGENIEVYSLTGTTGDCCKLALEYWLKDDLPDLIVSGINDGFNTGSDCLYSGTVAGGSGIRIFYEKAVYRYTQCKYSEDKAGKSFLEKCESSPARLAALF